MILLSVVLSVASIYIFCEIYTYEYVSYAVVFLVNVGSIAFCGCPTLLNSMWVNQPQFNLFLEVSGLDLI